MGYNSRFRENHTALQDSRLMNDLSKIRRYCKCGHSVLVPPKLKYIVCTHCGHRVYREERDKFKDTLERMLRSK